MLQRAVRHQRSSTERYGLHAVRFVLTKRNTEKIGRDGVSTEGLAKTETRPYRIKMDLERSSSSSDVGLPLRLEGS
jgi:hypothetical protein